jgi:uncharacterized protein (DUF1684 family)
MNRSIALALGICAVVACACNGRDGDSSAAAGPGGAGAGTPAAAPADHLTRVQAFRDKHEADYRRDWVSIAGLHFVEPGAHSVGSGKKNDLAVVANLPETAGRLTVKGTSMTFQPAGGIAATQQGKPVAGPIAMKEEGKPPAPEFLIGDVRLVAHQSGDRLALRVRDPNGPLAKDFRGFTWFAIDPQYRVVGRFIRDAESRDMTVLNTLGDMDTYKTEGVVEFTLQGQTLRIRPFTSRPKRFYIVFRDASAGQETYETARFLYSDLQDDGTTVLDFNEAYNPPCSFNPYTTCPIPLKENILPVKILAGEKAYPIHVSIPDSVK